ncbi:MAG: hypothetical protein WCD04_18430, partial [Terriglobia bacterium]
MHISLHRPGFLIALVMAACALVWPVALSAQTGLEGHWEGAIELPGTALQIRIDFKSAGAAWQANIDIPQQGAQGLPLQAVRFAAPQVHFELPAGPGLAVFDGKLDGNKVSGNFSQAGQTFPFSLERKSASVPAPAATATPTAKPSLDGLDEFVTQAMKDWKVPGLA